MSTSPVSSPSTAPGLRRSLSLTQIVFLGLAYMAPMAVFDTFGIVAEVSEGRVPLSYLLIFVAVAITAWAYSRMVRIYPRAGSAYTYTRESINPHLGFIVGWAATLDYLLLPMINALLSSIYMTVAFPDVPAWVWILGTIVICTGVNLAGVRLAAQVNTALVVIQIVTAVAFVVLTVKSILDGANGAAFSFAPFLATPEQFSGVASGAAILALSFLGFDAVTTMSEEARDPRRDIPRAIFLIVAAAGVFFVSVTYVMQVLFPDVTLVGDIVGASPEMAKYIGGALFQALFIGGYMVAVLGCGITQQMSAARLLYAMGRDDVLPRRLFARLNDKGVPSANLIIIGLLAATAVFLDLFQAASLINFGAFVAFTFVNLSVIATWLRFRHDRAKRGVIGWVVVPALGAAINVMLWFSLEPSAMLIGAIWTALGFAYLLWRTRLFRAAPPALTGPLEIEQEERARV
ncbi:APC family permease [Microbacterium esteraromaticum]|uniref:APC family permease n=1 Tax=Microbacterium esteraromaticum TaxID=57043 RepID=UPI00195BC850|nr:APC family permease [Microbacterium esteraromaticum]MBM7467372.1 putrescine importer [Microbacterium esteraromaticum]